MDKNRIPLDPPFAKGKDCPALKKWEALKEIDRLAKEAGIVYVLFDTLDDAKQLMSEMRFGHVAKKVMKERGIIVPELLLL